MLDSHGGHGWGWQTDTKPGDPIWGPCIRFHYTGTLEMLVMMIDLYGYAEDKEFLKKELLPMADESLLWWAQHWSRDEKGKLKMSPSRALESYGDCTNSAPDVAGLMWNLDRLLALSDDEIGLKRRSRWAKLRKALPAIPMMTVAGRPARLRIFIDRSIVEVFADNTHCDETWAYPRKKKWIFPLFSRQFVGSRVYPTREDSRGISFFSRGGVARVISMDVWQMHSIWPELKNREGE